MSADDQREQRAPLDLDALEELERAATPGPWSLECDSDDREMVVSEPYPYAFIGPKNATIGMSDDWVARYGNRVSEVCEFTTDDADLIAAARERDRLRALLAEVRLIAGPEDKTGRALLHILGATDGD